VTADPVPSIFAPRPVRQGGAQRLGIVLVFSVADLDHLAPGFDVQREACIGLAGAAVLTGVSLVKPYMPSVIRTGACFFTCRKGKDGGEADRGSVVSLRKRLLQCEYRACEHQYRCRPRSRSSPSHQDLCDVPLHTLNNRRPRAWKEGVRRVGR
jgi:hypothetical protein